VAAAAASSAVVVIAVGTELGVVAVAGERTSLVAYTAAWVVAVVDLGGLVCLQKLKDRRAHVAARVAVAVAAVYVDPAGSHQRSSRLVPCTALRSSARSWELEQKPSPLQLWPRWPRL
jgi:hypothetical protein